MPKTNLCKREVPHAQLARLIIGFLGLRHNPAADVAAILGCSENTARSRLKNPGEMTVSELTSLGRGLHIPIEDLRASIRY